MDVAQIRFTAPGSVALETIDDPLEVQTPTNVIVKTHYSLISAGTELACLAGQESWFPLPRTPGYAAVGEVTAVGASVTKVKPGDLVFTHGPHAAHFRIDTTDRYTGTCIKIPLGMRPDHALFARMASIALASLRVAQIELGDQVLITGLGQIGNLAAQLVQLQGGRAIAADLNAARRACARACGIATTIDSGQAEWHDEVRRLAGARGITTAIEATGLAAVATEILPLIRAYGEIILLGTPRAPFLTNATEIYSRIHLPGFVTPKGALEWRFPTFSDEFVKHSIERNSEILLELIASGRLLVTPFYTHRLLPAQAPEAYTGLREAKDEYVGVVFDWTI